MSDSLPDHEHIYVDEWCKCGRNEFFDVPAAESRMHVLTDLLAAHRLDDTDGTCTGCDWTWPDSSEIDMYTDLSLIHPAHVAEVVVQLADTAEEVIARVEALLTKTEPINRYDDEYDKGWRRGQMVLYGHVRAALRGDS